MFFKIGDPKEFIIFARKPLCWSLILIKPAALLKRLQYRWVFVNIAKFLRTAFLRTPPLVASRLTPPPHAIPLINTKNKKKVKHWIHPASSFHLVTPEAKR